MLALQANSIEALALNYGHIGTELWTQGDIKQMINLLVHMIRYIIMQSSEPSQCNCQGLTIMIAKLL